MHLLSFYQDQQLVTNMANDANNTHIAGRCFTMVVTGDYQEDQFCQKHPDDNDTHLAQEAVGEAVGE